MIHVLLGAENAVVNVFLGADLVLVNVFLGADLAVVKLSSPIKQFGSKITPVCLPYGYIGYIWDIKA